MYVAIDIMLSNVILGRTGSWFIYFSQSYIYSIL